VRDHIAVKDSAREFGYEKIMPDGIETKKETAKPASPPRGKDEVLHARPVKGEIDWAELSREHIRRYPKIRARLAE
jgi:hypothetical protein